MSNHEKRWTDDAAKLLKGKRIVDVFYMQRKDAKEMDWYHRPIVLMLEDGTKIYPSKDDEGNNGGSLFTTDDDLPIIPVIP